MFFALALSGATTAMALASTASGMPSSSGMHLITRATFAQKPLTYEVFAPDSLASAMMMGLIDQNSVFIMDKVEGNPTKLPSGKPAWASIVNLTDASVRPVEANTNAFCASGAVLPNGTWIVAGGNNAVTEGGIDATTTNNVYQSTDGRKTMRLLDTLNVAPTDLSWQDNGSLQMASRRWYPGLEVLADGSLLLVGGAMGGGYINRNLPNVNQAWEGEEGKGSIENIDGPFGANPTYEYFPKRNVGTNGMQMSQFMIDTSGLNMYPHSERLSFFSRVERFWH